jgi:hypothetical protein
MTATGIPSVPLGASGIRVSRLSLGSWRTFERISREQGIRVMRAARDAAALTPAERDRLQAIGRAAP